MNTIEFLQWWRPTGVLTLSGISQQGDIETRAWDISGNCWDDIGKWIGEREGKQNLYFIANEAKLVHKKPGKTEITEIHCAFTDADPDLSSGYTVGRAKIMDAAKELIKGTIPPSCIIDSGHGINALWRLAELPSSIEEFEAINKPFSEAMGGKGIYNVDRLLRLPGTPNLPTPTKVKKGYPNVVARSRVLFWQNASYTLDEIRAFAAKNGVPQANGKGSHDYLAQEVPHKSMLLYAEIMARWRGDQTGLNDTSRSGMDMSLGALLKARGFSFTEMCTILRAYPHGKGAENDDRQLARIWERSGSTHRPEPLPPQDSSIKTENFIRLKTEEEKDDPDYIEPNFAGPGGFVLIAGPPKAQKSFLLMEMLVSCAIGGKFLGGIFNCPRPLRVFYLQAEMNRKLLRKRARVFKGFTPEEEVLLKSNLIITERFHMILDPNGVKIAIDTIKRAFPNEPPDIIGIDPLANLFDGENENDNAQLMRFIAGRLEAIRQAVNPMAAIALAHHSRKVTSEDMARDPFLAIRGAGALRGYYDSAIVIFRKNEEERTRQLHFELRSGEAPQPMSCTLVDGRFIEASENKVEIDMGRQMLATLKAAWDAGKPLSLFPQAKREGKYAPVELGRKYHVSAKAVSEILTDWMRNDIITTADRDKHTRIKGIKVIGTL